MSGGSMNYLSFKVEEAEFEENSPLRRAFRKHLKKVAKALHAIEWNDSCDGYEGENELIEACLSKGAELEQLSSEAIDVSKLLLSAIEKARETGSTKTRNAKITP